MSFNKPKPPSMNNEFHICVLKEGTGYQITLTSKDVLELIYKIRASQLANNGKNAEYLIMKPRVWLQLKHQLSQKPYLHGNHGFMATVMGYVPVVCSEITSDIVLGDLPEEAGNILAREFFKQKEANAQQTQTT